MFLKNKKGFILSLFIILIILIFYVLEIKFKNLDYFISGDEEYYQNIFFEGKSHYYSLFSRIPSLTNFQEIPRILQILIFTFYSSKLINFKSTLFLLVYACASSFFLIILIRDPFILLSVIILLDFFANKRSLNILHYLLAIIIFNNIAFDIFCIFIFSIFVSIVIKYNNIKTYVLAALISSIVLFIFIDNIIFLLNLNIIEGARNDGNAIDLSLIGIIKAFITFYTGPGFLRLYYNEIYFIEFYPSTYIFSYLFYSILTYFCLTYFICKINIINFFILIKQNLKFCISILFSLFFSSVYIFSDSGSSGYRKRFIVLFLLITSIYEHKNFLFNTNPNKINLFFVIVFLITVNIYSIM
jgi:hypothetical protein